MAEALLSKIIERIQAEGPLSVAEYMAMALGDHEHGYYTTRDPFGAAGDFITAPEISQMFGELIGLWAAVVWDGLGRPSPCALAEVGPGRGTLMADTIRAARGVPGFVDTLEPHLIETSPALREIQAGRLSSISPSHAPVWHDRIPSLPEQPTILIANEFLDALPIEQLVKISGRWHRRTVALEADGSGLAWAVGSEAPDLAQHITASVSETAPEGAVVEVSPAVEAAVGEIGGHLAANGGAALLIDYGYERHAAGDTLQAVRQHRTSDPLTDPGSADLTAHVNFERVAEVARSAGCDIYGPVGQGAFLRSLGIEARAEALAQAARHSPTGNGHTGHSAVTGIATALHRLIGSSEMGTLFKVLAMVPHGAPSPPGPWEASEREAPDARNSGEPDR